MAQQSRTQRMISNGNGRRVRQGGSRQQYFEALEQRTMLTVTIGALPTIYGSTITLPAGKSIVVPLTATNTLSGPVTYTVTASAGSGIVPVVNSLNPAVSATRTFIRFATSAGNMDFQLFNDIAPQTVSYILNNLNSPDFINTIFHRIYKTPNSQNLSIVQGGDRDGDGQSNTVGVALEQELDPRLLFTGHGQLSEARTSQPDTGSSQFFITVDLQRGLDFGYTIYGQLVRGFDVLTTLNNTPVDGNGSPTGTAPVLNSISVIQDTTDAVVTLVSTNGTPKSGTITVTAKDANGNQDVKVFNVATATDTVDDPPYLAPPSQINRAIPENKTTAAATIIDVGPAVDLESSAYTLQGNALTSGFSGNFVDSQHISITPDIGFTGLIQLTVDAVQNNDSSIQTGRTYSFFVESGNPPTYSLKANDLFAKAGPTATFQVTYSDDTLLNVSTLTTNTAVSVAGPNGFFQPATFVAVDDNSNGATRTVTYQISAPGGNWDTPDAGGYYVVVNANQVKDTSGNASPAGAAGAFYYSPTAFFDERYYLTMNPDVAAAVASGALTSGYQHFIAQGQIEGRSATPFFTERFYDALYPDVAAAIASHAIKSGWEHFVLAGQFEGRYSNPAYDEKTYLRLNPDVAAAVAAGAFSSGLEHFILSGQYENRVSSLFYDVNTYISHNPDVVAAVASGTAGIARSVTEHFLIAGQHEGRVANTLFSESYYLATYPDVAAAVNNKTFASGFEHFELSGAHEKRDPSTLFDSQFYLAENPDVAAAVANGTLKSAFEHYMLAGRAEGRAAHA